MGVFVLSILIPRKEEEKKELLNEELAIYAVQDTLLGQTVPSSFT